MRSATGGSSRVSARGTVRLGIASTLGGLVGAIALLALPAAAFKAIVPILHRARARAGRRSARGCRAGRRGGRHDGTTHRAAGCPPLFCTGIYGGYFGAAQGILLLAIMGLGLDDDLQRINGLKNVLAGLVNLMAAVVFVFSRAHRVDGREAAGDRLDHRRPARRERRPAALARGAAGQRSWWSACSRSCGSCRQRYHGRHERRQH